MISATTMSEPMLIPLYQQIAARGWWDDICLGHLDHSLAFSIPRSNDVFLQTVSPPAR